MVVPDRPAAADVDSSCQPLTLAGAFPGLYSSTNCWFGVVVVPVWTSFISTGAETTRTGSETFCATGRAAAPRLSRPALPVKEAPALTVPVVPAVGAVTLKVAWTVCPDATSGHVVRAVAVDDHPLGADRLRFTDRAG